MVMPTVSSRPSLWSELFTARGRTNRGRLWLIVFIAWVAILVIFVPVAALSRAHQLAAPNEPMPPALILPVIIIATVLSVLWLVISILLTIRRLHDRDKSGHWIWLLFVLPAVLGAMGDALQKSGADVGALLLLVPSLAISVWAFVEIGCLRGTPGPNRFGLDPLQPATAT